MCLDSQGGKLLIINSRTNQLSRCQSHCVRGDAASFLAQDQQLFRFCRLCTTGAEFHEARQPGVMKYLLKVCSLSEIISMTAEPSHLWSLGSSFVLQVGICIFHTTMVLNQAWLVDRKSATILIINSLFQLLLKMQNILQFKLLNGGSYDLLVIFWVCAVGRSKKDIWTL